LNWLNIGLETVYYKSINPGRQVNAVVSTARSSFIQQFRTFIFLLFIQQLIQLSHGHIPIAVSPWKTFCCGHHIEPLFMVLFHSLLFHSNFLEGRDYGFNFTLRSATARSKSL
jgi:hypothetical protein